MGMTTLAQGAPAARPERVAVVHGAHVDVNGGLLMS